MISFKEKIVRARAPLRIGLAGGGTDISDFYNKYGGAVLNVAINKYAFSEISFAESNFTSFASDLNIEEEIDLLSLSQNNLKLPLHFYTYQYIMQKYNKSKYIPSKISTYCDAPIGSGLGSSSTLVVSMIKAWSEYLNLGLDEYTIAETAIYIERVICGFKGGSQDQYSASFGGFNFIEFFDSQTVVHPLKVKNWFQCEIESSMLLHFTGQSRFSGEIIEDQIRSIKSLDNSKIESLKLMGKNAYDMKISLLKNNKKEIIELIKKANIYKNKTSNKIGNELIKQRVNYAFKNGAIASKVSGAGGGGFILFVAEPNKILSLRDKLREFSNQTFFISICNESVQSWVV